MEVVMEQEAAEQEQYTKKIVLKYGDLIIDNNDIDYWYDTFTFGRTKLNNTYRFNNITVRNYGNLVIQEYANVSYINLNWSDNGVIRDDGGNFTLFTNKDLTIPATARLVANTYRNFSTITINGTLTHSGPQADKEYIINLTVVNFTINPTGTINITEKGYAGSEGPGQGVDTAASSGAAGGAAYGGDGGDGSSSVGGISYGSITTPVELGSGGGSSLSGIDRLGGKGGGAVFINVTNTFTINGSIHADAGSGVTDGAEDSGGGAGGGIYIIADTISGNGTISAIGGDGGAADAGSGSGEGLLSITQLTVLT